MPTVTERTQLKCFFSWRMEILIHAFVFTFGAGFVVHVGSGLLVAVVIAALLSLFLLLLLFSLVYISIVCLTV